jgi:Gas vesicle synthesis protein GvpL/GvpF
MTATYIYGVTDAGAELPARLRGVDGRSVLLAAHGGCAAIVSRLEDDRALGDRDDLVAHHRVLDEAVSTGCTVLPFRFGTAVTGPVLDDLLNINQEHFAGQLDRVRGCREFRLKVRYVEEALLREVLSEEPEIAALRARVRDVPEDAAYYERVRLGELTARSVMRRRRDEGQRLLDVLAARSRAVEQRALGREEEVLDAGFLIDDKDRNAFEQLVERLGKDNAGRIRMRLTGPLPPYDFMDQEILTWASSPAS